MYSEDECRIIYSYITWLMLGISRSVCESVVEMPKKRERKKRKGFGQCLKSPILLRVCVSCELPIWSWLQVFRSELPQNPEKYHVKGHFS